MPHDYFYGKQADRFAFIKIPKAVLLDAEYSGLSAEAKILYAVFLDRLSLSIKNEWIDDANRVFIIYSQKAIMQVLSCNTGKAAKVVAELETYNLIHKVKLGQGNPDRIYVLNFESETTVTEEYKAASETAEDTPVRNAKNESPEMRKSHFLKCENSMSKDLKNASQEMRNSHTNHTESIDTENNHTEFNHTEFNHTVTSNDDVDINISLSNQNTRERDNDKQPSFGTERIKKADRRKIFENEIRTGIQYDFLVQLNETLGKLLRQGKITLEEYEEKDIDFSICDKMIQYMADTCYEDKPVLIKGKVVRADKVKQRLRDIDRATFVSAYKILAPRWEGIENKKNYCITVLYEL